MSIDPRSAAADELLQALTVGDLAADDPAVVARLDADAQLRARWQALAATLAGLRELDAGTREGGTEEPHIDTRAAVRAFRSRAARRWWLVAAAAAAAALLVVLWLVREEHRPAPDPRLGGGDLITGLAPEDGADWPAGDPLSWSAVRGAAGYRVQVQPLPGGALLVLPGGADGEWLVTNSWRPTAPQRAALPAQFQWRVVAYDGSDDSMATSEWVTTRR